MARRKVRFTSLLSLARHKASGARLTTRHQVLSNVIDKEDATRREVAESTGLSAGIVSARINELIKDGILAEDKEPRACGVTGNLVHSVQLSLSYSGKLY